MPQIEAQSFFLLTSYNLTAHNEYACYQLLAAVSGHSRIKVFLCPELKSQLMNRKLTEAPTLSNGAGSSFAHRFVQAIYGAWSCGALKPYPAVGVQGSQCGPAAHPCHSIQETNQQLGAPALQGRKTCLPTQASIQNLSWMLWKQFVCTPGPAPL